MRRNPRRKPSSCGIPSYPGKVTPAGRKVFMPQYRTNAGERRKPALGLYSELTVEQARAIAQEWMAEVRRGDDPSAKKPRKPWTKNYTKQGQGHIAHVSGLIFSLGKHRRPSMSWLRGHTKHHQVQPDEPLRWPPAGHSE